MPDAVGAVTKGPGRQPEDAHKTSASAAPSSVTRADKETRKALLRSRFVGCLVGGAAGDALGAPVEFLRYSEIVARFGSTGITGYVLAYGRMGAITDDTQMTLFTAEGLIRDGMRRALGNRGTVEGVLAAAYDRWFSTQTGRPPRFGRDGGVLEWPPAGDGRSPDGWLMRHDDLHHRRGPGATCLAALEAMTVLGEPATNDSKGCGGVMRIAPVGLVHGWVGHEPRETMALGKALAALTHGHPTGAIAAGALAVLIAEIVRGRDVKEALAVVHACLAREPHGADTEDALQRAEKWAQQRPDDPAAAIPHIGEGWIAEEALAVGVYCALTARDFSDGVIRAVNHGGDSDSTGSITGNILGALWGVETIPASLLEPLELRDVITELAEDLVAFTKWYDGDPGDAGHHPDHAPRARMEQKYPGY